jgi:predicted nucleic acid-binding protein
MRLLVDTNIFLEVLLAQQRADEARAFLENPSQHELFISDFSLHSIGLILLRRRKDLAFLKFLSDMILGAGTQMAFLGPHEIDTVVAFAHSFSLDFDDGYMPSQKS